MTRHLVKAKQPGYAGKTLGIPFSDGQAIVDEHTVPAKLGRTPAQVLEAFKQDFPDYEVTPISDRGSTFTVPELPYKKPTPAPRAKRVREAKRTKAKPSE